MRNEIYITGEHSSPLHLKDLRISITRPSSREICSECRKPRFEEKSFRVPYAVGGAVFSIPPPTNTSAMGDFYQTLSSVVAVYFNIIIS